LVGPWRRIPIEPIFLGPGNYHVVGQNHAGSSDDLVFWQRTSIPGEASVANGIRLDGLSIAQEHFGPIRWGGWLSSNHGNFPIQGAIMGPMLFGQIIIPETSSVLLSIMAYCAGNLTFYRGRRSSNIRNAGRS
jgi:hypothetical protein